MGLGGIIDVAIGMSFLYVVLSLVCSGVNELIASFVRLRAHTLAQGIRSLLADPKLPDLQRQLYEHPLIQCLHHPGPVRTTNGRSAGPSYIPSRAFCLALLDSLGAPGTLDGVRQTIEDLPEGSNVRRILLALHDEGVKDLATYHARVGQWFDDAMSRVSGVYKRWMQLITALVGCAVAFGCAIDSGLVVDRLMHDGPTRKATAEVAINYVKPADGGGPRGAATPQGEAAATKQIADAIDQVDALALPVGWPKLKSLADDNAKLEPSDDKKHAPWVFWLARIFGMLFTALAISFGAPFWFDMLGRFMNLRGSGPPPSTDANKPASDDR